MIQLLRHCNYQLDKPTGKDKLYLIVHSYKNSEGIQYVLTLVLFNMTTLVPELWWQILKFWIRFLLKVAGES